MSGQWGPIDNPTIVDIVEMIIKVSDREGGYDKIALWKIDLAGAFT